MPAADNGKKRAPPVSDWDFASIAELTKALRSRKLSASELLEQTIARIEALDQRVNAIIVRDFDRARVAAKLADAAFARGEGRPLLGIPVTLKEPYNVAGLRTTWGLPQFKNFVPSEDALAVSRLKQAGAVIIGKTNIPTGLREFQSYNDIYGTTNNPWDFGRSPGGSSGGSAAALAAGFGPLSLGSDIGGSIRVPAHFCGVFGHKPTLGLIPLRGYSLPPAPPVPGQGDLAVLGPMTRYASDLALSLDAISHCLPQDTPI
jgi:amidase